MWEILQRWFDDSIKDMGFENAYFPLFITEEALKTEKDHVEGFAAEVAWVTKSGGSDLERPIAIRPTSETVMYPYYAQVLLTAFLTHLINRLHTKQNGVHILARNVRLLQHGTWSVQIRDGGTNPSF